LELTQLDQHREGFLKLPREALVQREDAIGAKRAETLPASLRPMLNADAPSSALASRL
jgi:hypothetical protein